MITSGFYKWAIEGDGAGGAAPLDGSVKLPADADGPPESSNPSRAEDLEIEKKRLQLVGIDPEKFDYFFDKYFDRIFSYAFWRSGGHDEAADVAGETFLRAWDRRHQFRWQGYSFGAWLFQIARSIISHRDRRAANRRELAYDVDYHEQIESSTPADLLDRKTDLEWVRQCMRKLADDPHEVLVLHFFAGMTTRQIATVTKMPQGTVNSHLRRGKQSVRRCLEEAGNSGLLSEAGSRIVRMATAESSGLSVVGEPNED